MHRFLIVLVILFVGNMNASSQESGDHKPIAQKEQKSEQNQTAPKNESSPIKKQKSEPVKETGKKPDTYPDEKLNIDRQIAEYTGQLAVFTKWLVIVTAILAAIAIWQGLQLKSTVWAMRDDYVSTHRPKIRIKHVYITSEVWGNKPIEIKLVIVNIGITPALILKMNLETTILPEGNRLPPRETYSERDKTISLDKLDSGMTVALPNITRRDLSMEDHPRLLNRSWRLYCYGFVEYTDTEGRIRKTAFCRIWEPPSGVGSAGAPGRFVKYDDPDYEYQD